MNYQETISLAVNQQKKIHASFKSEMIDHYCSMYERQIIHKPHDVVVSFILSDIESHSIKPLKRQFMTTKNILVLTVVMLCISISAFAFINLQDKNIDETFIAEKSTIEHELDPPYGSPLKTEEISSGYGNRMYKKKIKFHKGVDFRAPSGTDIITVEKGVVIKAAYNKKKGNYIEIRHDDIYITRYFHLSTLAVKEGDKVDKGQFIGTVGTTGLSTAPHLHYEILKNGKHVDPVDYIKA